MNRLILYLTIPLSLCLCASVPLWLTVFIHLKSCIAWNLSHAPLQLQS